MTTPATVPGAADAVTEEPFTLHGCRCDESTLNRLLNAVREDFASGEVTVEGTWQGTRYRQDDLGAMKAAIARSVSPGDPRRLGRLRIEARAADRTVTVTLADTATVTVEATNATWTTGRAVQVRRILEHAGGRVRPGHRRPWRWALGGAGLAGGIAALLATAILGRSDGMLIVLVAVLSASGGAAGGFLLGRHLVERRRSVTWIEGEIPRRGWSSWDRRDRLAAVALAVPLVAALLIIIGN